MSLWRTFLIVPTRDNLSILTLTPTNLEIDTRA
jgi:hypothetical protein